MSPNHEVLLELAADALLTTTPDGQVLWANTNLGRALGRAAGTLVGQSLLVLVHPDDLFSTLDALESVASSGERVRFRNRLASAWKSWIWFEWSAQQVDRTIHVAGRNVTAEVADQAATLRRLGMLELAEDLAGLGHWFVDLEEETVLWSPEVFRIHGLSSAAFKPTLAKGIESYHSADRALVERCVTGAINDQAPFEFEARVVRPDGSTRWVHSIGQPQVDARSSRTTGIFGVFRDITNDSRFLRSRELEQFVHVASHDLKAPARTIRTYMDLLAEKLELPPDLREWWHFAHSSAQRMEELIQSLLLYAQAGSASNRDVVELESVLAEVRADLAAHIQEQGALLEIGPMPRVAGDKVRLRQVFQNLIQNALKFRRDAAPIVRVHGVQQGEEWVLTVTDNGQGFESRHAERIFEPFQRLHTSDEIPGTGMGLAVVQRIVQETGGRIWVTSKPGVGSTFFVLLQEGESLKETSLSRRAVARE